MHAQTLETLRHKHDFAVIHKKGESRAKLVLYLTAVTMIIEIVAGISFGSMALLADGWHMGTHVAAFMITIFAYNYSKKHENNPQFTFGTGKVSVLGGFSSAVALFVVAMIMAVESIGRIFNPEDIKFNEAIAVAALGLFINIISAFLLRGRHEHDHHHGDEQPNSHPHHDHNLKAAYFHVMADAITSLLAIAALFAGKIYGWNWFDPVAGLLGALVIARWSSGLIKETSPILLDENTEENKKKLIKTKIEADSDNRIADLHLWKVGPNDYAVIISLVTHFPKPAEYYKELLKDIDYLSHITVEITLCDAKSCILTENRVFL